MAIEVDLNRIALALESLVEIGADVLGKLGGAEAVEQLSASTQQQLPDPVMAELDKLTRVQLVERLKERGLKTSGNKSWLIGVLWEAIRQEKQQTDAEAGAEAKAVSRMTATEAVEVEAETAKAIEQMTAPAETPDAEGPADGEAIIRLVEGLNVKYADLRALAEKHFSIAGKADLKKWYEKAAPGVAKLTEMSQEQQDRLYEILVVLEWARRQPGLFVVEAHKINKATEALETQDAVADALVLPEWSALYQLVTG